MELEVLTDVDGADLSLISDLLSAVAEHDDHRALGEHKWLDLVHGGRRGVLGLIAREHGHDHAVGYAHLSRSGASWGLEVAVHPEHRGIGVELTLTERAVALAAEHGGGRVNWWVFQPTETHEAIAHRLGLARGRDLFQMRCPLDDVPDPSFPDGIHLRTFVPGRDEQAWLDVNNHAFRHHPEQGAWDLDTLRRRMEEDWFDPGGFLLADDEQGLAGFCWTKVHSEERVGEIYVIGVDPAREGIGLGKALVLAGMRSLSERGLPNVMLYVDSSNERAVALYRRLGYEVHHLDRAYVCDVDPVAPEARPG